MMQALLNIQNLQTYMPPLARLLGTSRRAANGMAIVSAEAKAGPIPASMFRDRVVGRAGGADGERALPGLAQMRKAWRECIDGQAAPSSAWLTYAAWSVAQATEGELTPTSGAIEIYLLGIRDAGVVLAAEIDVQKGVLYPARGVSADGEPIDPMLTTAQMAPLTTAIDALVAAVRKS